MLKPKWSQSVSNTVWCRVRNYILFMGHAQHVLLYLMVQFVATKQRSPTRSPLGLQIQCQPALKGIKLNTNSLT